MLHFLSDALLGWIHTKYGVPAKRQIFPFFLKQTQLLKTLKTIADANFTLRWPITLADNQIRSMND